MATSTDKGERRDGKDFEPGDGADGRPAAGPDGAVRRPGLCGDHGFAGSLPHRRVHEPGGRGGDFGGLAAGPGIRGGGRRRGPRHGGSIERLHRLCSRHPGDQGRHGPDGGADVPGPGEEGAASLRPGGGGPHGSGLLAV